MARLFKTPVGPAANKKAAPVPEKKQKAAQEASKAACRPSGEKKR